ncbi:MAG TPA: tetratricopeptide repeat protein [Xanthobacteraceae bacterium]|jgi:tetratricopeptide (TPR) repeat protein|nr:tetratricopeptide repeat protein [Xanthobacteraceae bacterium]
MAGSKTLDDILGAEGLAAEHQALGERWNARIAGPRAATQPTPMPKPSVANATTRQIVVPARTPGGALRWRAPVIGILAVGLGIALIVLATQKSPDELAIRADQYRQMGEFDAAIASYTEAIRLYVNANPREPKLAAIYCSRADIFASRKEYGRAVADYTDALQLASQNGCALKGRANAYQAESIRGLAIADYLAAVHLDADNDLTWMNRGDDLLSAGEYDTALQLFRDSTEVFQRLTKAEPANARWRLDLSLSYYKSASALIKQDRFADVLDSLRDSLATMRPLVAKDSGNSQLHDDLDTVINALGVVSYHLVLKKDFVRALEAANLAISLSPKKVWLYTNQAHALMFLGRVDAAKSIYLQYRGKQDVSGGDSWESAILKDFDAMRKAGLSHPLMNEIETRFRGRV